MAQATRSDAFINAHIEGLQDEFDAALRLAEARVAAEMRSKSIRGLSVAIVFGGRTVWSAGFGLADPPRKTAADTNTVYRIASISKLITATAVMQLRDAGKLRLDDALVEHIPEFTVRTPFDDCPTILLRHLLSHVSGIQREPYLDHWVTLDAPTIARMIDDLRDQELLFPPMTAVHYSNLAFGLLGEVVRRVSHLTSAEYIQERILGPLGMSSTDCAVPSGADGRMARGYFEDQHEGDDDDEPVPQWSLEGFIPAGGLYSTAADLARFVAFQFKGNADVLRDTTRREMHLPAFRDPSTGDAFGIGWALGDLYGAPTVGHAGAVYGYRSQCLLLPAHELGVVVLTNSGYEPNRLCRHILETLLPTAKRLREAKRAPDAATAPAGDWSELTGSYRWRGFNSIHVTVLDGRMIYYTGEQPSPNDPKLEPAAGALFRILGGPYDREVARFERDERGQVFRLWLGAYPYARVR